MTKELRAKNRRVLKGRVLHLERDENECRLDPTPEEKIHIGRRIEELEKPKADARKKDSQAKPGQKVGSKGSDHMTGTLQKGETTAVAASHVGMSEAGYRRAKRVVKATEKQKPAGLLRQALT